MLKLKELRTKFGKTQTEVAEAMHISRVNYCNYENGKRDPSSDTLRLLALYFNVTVDELLGFASESYTEDESHLLLAYRGLNVIGKQLMTDYADMLVSKPAYRQDASIESAM